MKDLLSILEKPKQMINIKAVKIALASPEKIKEWSYGEVKNQRPLITER